MGAKAPNEKPTGVQKPDPGPPPPPPNRDVVFPFKTETEASKERHRQWEADLVEWRRRFDAWQSQAAYTEPRNESALTDQYQRFVYRAVAEADAGNSSALRRLAEYLALCNDAQGVLRAKGYGWTGLNILETVQEVPEAT